MIYEITNGSLSAKINSLGAEIISLTGACGYQYIWQGDEDWDGHAPVLFPICGRIKDSRYTYLGKLYEMDIHGLAPYSEFTLESKTDDCLVLSLSSTEESLKKYPFDFKLTASYKLSDSRLLADFTVENRNNAVMPYMFGWHPGFNYDPSCEVEDFYFDFKGSDNIMLHPVIDRKFILDTVVPFPTNNGIRRVNNAELDDFDTMILDGVNGYVAVRSDKAEHSVEVKWSDNIGHLAVWRTPLVNSTYVCIEPWTDLPADGSQDEDFETKKMSRLNAKESVVYSYEVTLH